ncbi:MAG: hypothetical protein GX612_02705, partial [Bacteroidales bacterium]|nr:hypothetical protein [Bacteroidales bacterium]
MKREIESWYNEFSRFRATAKPVLSLEQKRSAKGYFARYGFKIKTDWHNYYTAMTGEFSEKYIPGDLMYTVIVPYLNYMPFESAYQDKSFYSRLFPNVLQPECIVQRTHSFFYNNEYLPILKEEAIELCKNMEQVIIKPTIFSCQGRGVKLITFKNGKTNDGLTVEELFNLYGDNFIIQKRIKQHQFFASLNGSSLNTMRILTLRMGNEIVSLSHAV